LPEHPALLIFHPLAEELPHGNDRGLTGKAIINVLVVLVCPEPQLVGIGNKYKAEKQEQKDKTDGGSAKIEHSG
jgi:hypothetical protein